MRALRPILVIAGVLALLMGLLWIGQGLGYIHWPASSFMIDKRPWAIRGVLLGIGGILLILAGRRR